jgi:hypothetical protein
MRPHSHAHNPFMLMLQPEQVLAAVERSEKLGGLNRRLCHPLDRPVPAPEAPRPRQLRERPQPDDLDA